MKFHLTIKIKGLLFKELRTTDFEFSTTAKTICPGDTD